MISVNGIPYHGNNISVINGRVIIDGVDVTSEQKVINITVYGDLQCINGEFSTITVHGNVTNGIKNGSGDISITGNVNGNIKTGSGDVNIEGSVTGDVETGSGDIIHN